MYLDDIHSGFEMHAIFLLLIKWQEGGLKLKKPPGEINEAFYRISTEPHNDINAGGSDEKGATKHLPFSTKDSLNK